jgi:hypothetical protein
MELFDMLEGGGAFSGIRVDDDTMADIKKVLTGHHADVLDQKVTPVGHGDFGGSATGATLAANADLAHQHVVAALKEMAEGLAGFATALQQAADHLTSIDDDSATATSQIDTSLDRVGTTFDGADTRGTSAEQATVSGTPAATPAPASIHPGGAR